MSKGLDCGGYIGQAHVHVPLSGPGGGDIGLARYSPYCKIPTYVIRTVHTLYNTLGTSIIQIACHPPVH
jgi:hypothetical protein